MTIRTTHLIGAVVLLAASITPALCQNETQRFFAKFGQQRDAVGNCYKAQVDRYARATCEPVATIVDAAYGRCASEERVYRDAMVASGGASC